jgi:hypothetical protein
LARPVAMDAAALVSSSSLVVRRRRLMPLGSYGTTG